MAKTIKFNLNLDGFPVRNIEGIQEHFSLEDMLEYYKSGVLQKWLGLRGYKDQLESLNSKGDNASEKEIVESLMEIFGIDDNLDEIQHLFQRYEDEKKRFEDEKQRYEEYKKIDKSRRDERDEMINDYHSGYEKLVRHMIDNGHDMAALKADAQEMEQNYLRLFELNYFSLFMKLINNAPKAIYAFMTRDNLKDYFLGKKYDTPLMRDAVRDRLKSDVMPLDKIKEILGRDVKIENRYTDGEWKPIGRDNAKVLVLYIAEPSYIHGSGMAVRSNNDPRGGEVFRASDINGRFVILDGLEYQCSDDLCELMYMEV